jgi:hypothetical protein
MANGWKNDSSVLFLNLLCKQTSNDLKGYRISLILLLLLLSLVWKTRREERTAVERTYQRVTHTHTHCNKERRGEELMNINLALPSSAFR